jgi:hypothetical protein
MPPRGGACRCPQLGTLRSFQPRGVARLPVPSKRTPVRLMARPPQYERKLDVPDVDDAAVKNVLKRVAPADRARVLAWLCTHYNDEGAMFSPQLSRRRQRIALDGTEYWLVRVPKRS